MARTGDATHGQGRQWQQYLQVDLQRHTHRRAHRCHLQQRQQQDHQRRRHLHQPRLLRGRSHHGLADHHGNRRHRRKRQWQHRREHRQHLCVLQQPRQLGQRVRIPLQQRDRKQRRMARYGHDLRCHTQPRRHHGMVEDGGAHGLCQRAAHRQRRRQQPVSGCHAARTAAHRRIGMAQRHYAYQ